MNPQLEALQRRVGGYPIELPAAALMAGAVLLATIALPDWRFERAVAATGLPAILSAALLLDHLGLPDAAARVEAAVLADLADRVPGASRRTSDVGDAIASRVAG